MNRQRLAHGRVLPFRKNSTEQIRRVGCAADRMLAGVLEAQALAHQFTRNRAAFVRCAKAMRSA